jgi:hypothetical protein
MSFGTLLAAGKSWMGGEGAGRYRMRNGVRLPKFIAPGNPFKAEVGEEAPGARPPAPLMAARDGTDGTNGIKPALAVRAESFSWWGYAGQGLRRAASFCREQNPLARVGRPKLPGIPRFGKRPVQSEFSLEQVRVMRGDLTDADLEIIPAATLGKSVGSPAWKNLTARMFGARGEQRVLND